MRYTILAALLLFVLVLAGCSFSTDFVVINASQQSIQVRYTIGETGMEPLVQAGKPATMPASELGPRDWQELSPNQYAIDREKLEVTVSLSPGIALRIHKGREWRASETGEDFIIKKLSLGGANGEIALNGNQVYKNFVAVPKPFYAFGPPTTLLTLTYK